MLCAETAILGSLTMLTGISFNVGSATQKESYTSNSHHIRKVCMKFLLLDIPENIFIFILPKTGEEEVLFFSV